MILPLFLALATHANARDIDENQDTLGVNEAVLSSMTTTPLIQNILTNNPGIIQKVLLENPEILDSFFKKHTHVLYDAQQKMIEDFSEHVSENLLTHTNETLENSPELWTHMGKNPINPGSKKVVAFLDPLCPHSTLLFKDLMELAHKSDQGFSVCPHWIAHHQDKKSMLAVRALLAAYAMGKIKDYIDLWIHRIENLSQKDITNIASQLGLNSKRFKNHMFSQETNKCIQDARQYRNQFRFQGFPTLVYKKSDVKPTASVTLPPDDASGPSDGPFFIIEGRPSDPKELSSMLSR